MPDAWPGSHPHYGQSALSFEGQTQLAAGVAPTRSADLQRDLASTRRCLRPKRRCGSNVRRLQHQICAKEFERVTRVRCFAYETIGLPSQPKAPMSDTHLSIPLLDATS